jgi:hypothetical protein
MDRIPIGGTPHDPHDGEHDNVLRLPSVQASDEVVGIPWRVAGFGDDSPDDGPEMSWEEAVAADAEADVPEDPPPVIPGAGWRRCWNRACGWRGMFSAGASAVADALRSTMPNLPTTRARTPRQPWRARAWAPPSPRPKLLPPRRRRPPRPWDRSCPGSPTPPRFRARRKPPQSRPAPGRQWKATQAETAQAATAFLTVLIPEITTAILDQIDPHADRRERVDINAIVEDVDMDRIVGRLDIASIVTVST